MAGDRSRALLIEEDDAYRATIGACLRLAGCLVNGVRDPQLAQLALDRRQYDLVVWGTHAALGDHRREVISEIRLRTEAPLIVIAPGFESAQADLETGADQWLPKPFVPGALLGSIRAALRRSGSQVSSFGGRLEIRGMVLEGRHRTLSLGDQEVGFTRQEWDLMIVLVTHANHFLEAAEIQRLGWRAGEHGAAQLRIYVGRLRRKFAPLELPCRLLSQQGRGYCLSFEAVA